MALRGMARREDSRTIERFAMSTSHDAEQYRLAQAARLLRFYRANGLSDGDIGAGARGLDLSPICGPDGRIEPESEDYPPHAES